MSRFITYDELMKIPSYAERLEALSLKGYRYQAPTKSNSFYISRAWRRCKRDIIQRDLGCDIATFGLFIDDTIIVHHIDPLLQTDIDTLSPKCFDPNRLITVSLVTHNHIHYGTQIEATFERKPGDTKLW